MWRKIILFVLAALSSTLAQAAPTILVFGDSLSAAYGIRQQDGWVTLLQRRLQQQRLDYNVINASVSGETSSGGASRISAALAQHKPAVTIIELGANDGLRGLPVAQMAENLAAIVRAAQKAGSRVLLVGMRLPPNYGARYIEEYAKAFADLARRYQCAFVPFLLEGVAAKREYMQDDNLHPAAAAQEKILDNVWPRLRPLLKPPGAKS
jgi:acyl-CoA thioesterase-1